jgi:hypothetical protein
VIVKDGPVVPVSLVALDAGVAAEGASSARTASSGRNLRMAFSFVDTLKLYVPYPPCG